MNNFLLIVNPKTGVQHAILEKGFKATDKESQGFKVDRYQDGREYTGDLPKLSKKEREALGSPPGTPEDKVAPVDVPVAQSTVEAPTAPEKKN